MPRVRIALAVMVAAIAFLPLPVAGAAVPLITYFPQTGHTLTLGFGQFVKANGGVEVFGYPLTDEISDAGRTVQYFQHVRLEWHAELPPGQQVVVSALGADLHKSLPAVTPPPVSSPVLEYFPTTGHTVADGFLAYYHSHDASALLGAPITEELSEQGHVVQYFSNAELVWQPGAAVTLGNLGVEAVAANGWHDNLPPLAPVPEPPQAAADSAPRLTSDAGPAASDPTTGAATIVSSGIASRTPVGGLGHIEAPVLAYHHISAWPSPYSVSTQNFAAQLTWLASNGYHSVTLRQLFAALYAPATLPAKPVVITIDDGYDDAATNARQLLKNLGMTATFFIPTWQTRIKPEVFRAMDAEGFDIEAHSRMHPDLTTLSDQAAWSEIAGSKADLEHILGHPISLFAYPYGALNPRISAMVSRAGYRGGIGAYAGRVQSVAAFLNEPRILVDRGDDLANFAAKVVGKPYCDTLEGSTGQSGPPNADGYRPGATRDSQPTPTYDTSPPAVAPDTTSGSVTDGGADVSPAPSSSDASAPDSTAGSGGTDSSHPGGRGQLYE